MKKENKFILVCLQAIKENINNGKEPIYNPVCISGLSKGDRTKIFQKLFDKGFNDFHKIKCISCNDIKINEEFDFNYNLIIIENIQFLVDNHPFQRKICDIVDKCLKNNIQIILCSDINTENLKLNEKLKCRLTWGISLYLK